MVVYSLMYLLSDIEKEYNKAMQTFIIVITPHNNETNLRQIPARV